MVMCLVLFTAGAKTSHPQYGSTQNGLKECGKIYAQDGL